MTKTDDPRVLLLADAWRRKPTHSIPPSSHCPYKGMGTSDWSLPRVTAIAQAGGAARCSSAVAMAADKLLSWMQGSKSTVRLFNKHLHHGFQAKKRKIALYLGAFHAGIKRVELKTGLIYLCRSYSRTAHLSREDDNIRPKLLTGVCLYGSDYDHWIKLQSQHKQKLLLHVQHCLLTYSPAAKITIVDVISPKNKSSGNQ